MFELLGEFIAMMRASYIWDALKILVAVAPIWVPIMLLYLFYDFWLSYKRLHYLSTVEYVLLEIKLPQMISKTPAAMEMVLAGIANPSGGALYKTFVLGEVRPWWSFEIVSLGGDVHFFIWTDKKSALYTKNLIYSQYPDVEIVEVPDYTNFTESDPSKVSIWGTHFVETGKDDVDPIKTYQEFGIKEGQKPEEMIDPMTPTLEYLGHLKRGEQVWIQILARPHKKEKWDGGETLKTQEEWKSKVDKKIESIKKNAIESFKKLTGTTSSFLVLEPGVDDYIKTLRRMQDQYTYEICMRGMYIAEEGSFRDTTIVGLIGAFRQFNHVNGNGLKIDQFTDVSNFWKNLSSITPLFDTYIESERRSMKTEFFEAYRLRSFFYPPYGGWKVKPYVLTTEELATIYHFPGGVAQTPTFKRIESKKAEPPSNLPI